MKVCGIILARNEADIIELNVRYHLGLGIDEMVVIDNASTDDTHDVVEKLARAYPVRVVREPGPYLQSELTSRHARRAAERGCDWVIPIDADEFWYTPGRDLRAILSDASAGILLVKLVNFIQRRDRVTGGQDSLLTMTGRIPDRIARGDARLQVEADEIGFVEAPYPPKCLSRASSSMTVHVPGAYVTGVEGGLAATDEIRCLHAPFRARCILEARIERGRRVDEAGLPPGYSWHFRRWARMAEDAEALEREWAANSYDDLALDVGGRKHPLVFDTTLADAVRPFVEAREEEMPAVGRHAHR